MAFKRIFLLTIPVAVGLVVLVLGIVLGFVVFPNILENEVEDNVVLREGTDQWDRFKDIPFPFDFKVHFFTIENPVEVMGGARPRVVERGPYIYKETKQKINTTISGDIVTYNDLWSFEFDVEGSAPLTENDEITVLNAPLMAVLQNLEDLPLALPGGSDQILSDIFENTQLFFTTRVGPYGLNGIKMCDPTRSSIWSSKLVCLAMMLMNLKLLKYNQDLSIDFSLYGYKTIADGPFTINTGTRKVEDLGLITSYKGKEYTTFWNGEQTSCDKVGGRYTTFPPFMEQDSTWSVYSTDICKSATIHYTGETTFKDVEAYKFAMNKDSFVSPDQSETCICIDRTKGLNGESHCFSDGVMDLQNCLGAPVILSFPHFMWAGEQYSTNLDGLNTNPNDTEQYTTVLEFQPHLGFPLRGAIRIQFNLVLRPFNYAGNVIESTRNILPTLFPIIWLEEGFQFTDDLIDELDEKLLSNLVLMDVATWVLVGVGCLVLVVASAFCVYCQWFRKK